MTLHVDGESRFSEQRERFARDVAQNHADLIEAMVAQIISAA